jgi:hypothetical protein
MTVSPDLLEILACPQCKSDVFLDESGGGEFIQCTSADCRRRYEVRDDIPVMLIDEATVLDQGEFEAVLARRPAARS